MRLTALLLPALFLLLLACKPDPGDEAGESSTGSCPNDASFVAEADPNYLPCDCDFKCDGGARCRFSDMSSICQPQCTNGPTCENAEVTCVDSDCPALSGRPTVCDGGFCTLYCDEKRPCPNGYVCLENIACQLAH